MVTTGYDTAEQDKLLTVSGLGAFETRILDDYQTAVLTDGANIVEDTAKMFGKNINRREVRKIGFNPKEPLCIYYGY